MSLCGSGKGRATVWQMQPLTRAGVGDSLISEPLGQNGRSRRGAKSARAQRVRSACARTRCPFQRQPPSRISPVEKTLMRGNADAQVRDQQTETAHPKSRVHTSAGPPARTRSPGERRFRPLARVTDLVPGSGRQGPPAA